MFSVSFNPIGAVKFLSYNNGIIKVTQLANQACLSRKQFERKFSAMIGLSPRQFIRVIRFQKAIYLKNLFPNMSLTTLAHETGFFDQSHMVNEFKLLSGLTPGHYFSDCEALSDFF